MPKIAVDEFGKKKIYSILKGKVNLICYEKKPLLWQYRQLKKGTKLYIYRNINEKDLVKAIIIGKKLYYQISEREKKENKLISELIDEWISINEEKQFMGQISLTTFRGIKSTLRSILFYYLIKEKGLKKISDIKIDTLIDFSRWRINNSWKIIYKGKNQNYPKLSTINLDIYRIKDWFNNYLIPEGYIDFIPKIVPSKLFQDQFEVNPPIPIDTTWPKILAYFNNWCNEISNYPNKKRLEYYRRMYIYFVLVSYHSGIRAKELLGEIETIYILNKDSKWISMEVYKGGIRWCDIKLEEEDPKSKSKNLIQSLKVKIYIVDSINGAKREVYSSIGYYLKSWKNYSIELRNKFNLPDLKYDDYVFFNPFTSKPYSYSQVNKTWIDMRNSLFCENSTSNPCKPYTLSSLRNSFIFNQIILGNDLEFLKKISGQSRGLLKHYYKSKFY